MTRAGRLLAGVALLLAAAAGPVFADDDPGPPPDLSVVLSDNGWVDRTHDYLSHRSLSTVQWFDDFFGDKTREDVAPAESTIRWRNNFRFGTDRTFTYRTDLRAGIRLNQHSRRLRLVFSSETFEDALGINRDATVPRGVSTSGALRQSSTELRYEFPKTERSQSDVGAGVLVKLPLVAYVRARYRYSHPLGDNTYLRFSPTAFWRTRDGLGQSMAVDLEHRFSEDTFFRWGNSETTTEKTNGMEWNSEPSILRAFGKHRAGTFAVGMSGATRPLATVNTYYVLLRYRQAVLREWLFAEAEPMQSWVHGTGGGYHPVSAITFRFEVVVKGEPSH